MKTETNYQKQIDRLHNKIEQELKVAIGDRDRMRKIIELLMNKITHRPSHRIFRKACRENLNLKWYYDHRKKFSEVEIDFKKKFVDKFNLYFK